MSPTKKWKVLNFLLHLLLKSTKNNNDCYGLNRAKRTFNMQNAVFKVKGKQWESKDGKEENVDHTTLAKPPFGQQAERIPTLKKIGIEKD